MIAPLPIPARAHVYPRLSPDGRRFALDIRDQKQDIVTWDMRSGISTQLTFDAAADIAPIWSPDGKRVAYLRSGRGLFLQSANGSGTADQIIDAKIDSIVPNSFTADGGTLLVTTQTASGFDIQSVDLGTRMMVPLLADPMVNEANAEISPNGRWLAYESDETGQFEINVRPFPDIHSGRRTISNNGATRPAWNPAGGELFFMGGGSQNSPGSPLMAVTVTTADGTFQAGSPRQLLPGPFFSNLASRTYDVTKDGQRFIVIQTSGGPASSRVVLVENWFEELRRLSK